MGISLGPVWLVKCGVDKGLRSEKLRKDPKTAVSLSLQYITIHSSCCSDYSLRKGKSNRSYVLMPMLAPS